MTFNLADLNKRISIQRPTKTADGMGGFTSAWTNMTATPLWASIWPVSAREIVKDKQTMGEITHRIRIRFKRGVTTECRVQYKNRYFNIVGVVNPGEDNEWLDILCKEAG